MSSTLISVGEPIPTRLQLEDGNTTMFPQAIVYNNLNVIIATINLFHSANGNYAPATDSNMPDLEFVNVVYIVYSNAGRTIESVIHMRSTDVFVRNDVAGNVWDEVLSNHIIVDSFGAFVGNKLLTLAKWLALK